MIKLFDKVLKSVQDKRENQFNCIAWNELFPRLSNYIPGVQKGKYYAVTGSPGSGKTQFTDFSFLYHPLNFEGNLIPEITYFSFEISKEAKIKKGICKRLFEKYGISISPNVLDSIGQFRVSDEIMEKVKECADYFYRLEEFVTFYDEPVPPSKIAKIMKSKFDANGRIEDRLVSTPTGSMRVPDSYVETNPNKYQIFIFDHIRLMAQEPGQTLHQTLSTFSSNNVQFRNKYNATIINVHQQSSEGAVEQFNKTGDNVVAKVEPQLALLGDNRTLAQDYDVVLGMFSPHRYELGNYRGYDTRRFGDKCRFLSVLKNREGEPDKTVGLYFDGMTNYLEELPKPMEFSILKNGVNTKNELLYEKYQKGIVGILDQQKKFNFS